MRSILYTLQYTIFIVNAFQGCSFVRQPNQVRDESFKQDDARNFEKILTLILSHVENHPLKDYMVELLSLMTAAGTCRTAIKKYISLGTSPAQRVQRDPVNGYLMTASKAYMQLLQPLHGFQ